MDRDNFTLARALRNLRSRADSSVADDSESSHPSDADSSKQARLSIEDIVKLVDDVRGNWIGLDRQDRRMVPHVVVLESMQDPMTPSLAVQANAAQLAAGAAGSPAGFILHDVVYLIADQITSERQALDTLAHEAIGHWGLRVFYGKHLDSLLEMIASKNQAELQSKAQQYGLNLNRRADRLEAAEELLADLAGQDRDPTIAEEIEAAHRAVLRLVCPRVAAQPYTQAEILVNFIAPVRRSMVDGASIPGQSRLIGFSQVVRQSVEQQVQSVEFRSWFEGSKAVEPSGEPLVLYHHGDFAANPDSDSSFVPRVPFHVGTLAAASSRALQKPIDDEIAAVTTYQDEHGRWHWDDGAGYCSEDRFLAIGGEAGFASERQALDDGISQVLQTADLQQWGQCGGRDGGVLTPVYISVRNVLRMDDQQSEEAWSLAIEQAKLQGYDGIVYRNKFEDKGSDSFVVFRPEQVKAAAMNTGAFSPMNSDVRYQRGGDAAVRRAHPMFARVGDQWVACEKERHRNFLNWARAGGVSSPLVCAGRDSNMVATQEPARVIRLGQRVEPDAYRTGQSVVVECLHGTTHAGIEEFERSRACVNAHLGAGIYASNDPVDVAKNYANEKSPDLTQRIEHLADLLSLQDDAHDDEAHHKQAYDHARQLLHGGAPNTMKLFMRFLNPAIMGGPNETYFDIAFDEDADPDGQGKSGCTGRLVDFINALDSVSGHGIEFSLRDVRDLKDTLWSRAAGEGLTMKELREIVVEAMCDTQSTTDGDAAAPEFFRQVLEACGYDGVIDVDPLGRFGPREIESRTWSGQSKRIRVDGMSGMSPSTVHYTVFEPEQVKSATANTGAYGVDSRLIRFHRQARAVSDVILTTEVERLERFR